MFWTWFKINAWKTLRYKGINTLKSSSVCPSWCSVIFFLLCLLCVCFVFLKLLLLIYLEIVSPCESLYSRRSCENFLPSCSQGLMPDAALEPDLTCRIMSLKKEQSLFACWFYLYHFWLHINHREKQRLWNIRGLTIFQHRQHRIGIQNYERPPVKIFPFLKQVQCDCCPPEKTVPWNSWMWKLGIPGVFFS